ncbi:YkvI family membrane protein [Alloscardovia criceti]|uniref:YkvI family membrane protein n=1 Tax=Alloscardovia criceti TaxID=356828 RepID=UPI000361496E|nr:hypothetical protein [Alloscardovia criceti]
MKKEYVKVAFAYVGIIVGAGLSSGQDILQYFVSFGLPGVIGAAVLTIMSIFFGKVIISLGSYYGSENHDEVLREISHPVITKIIDYTLIVSNFVIAFVMLAGAGANANQQFGMAPWLGALICALLTIGVAFLDFEKITNILGIFTPILLVLICIIGGYTLFTADFNTAHLDAVASTVPSSMPNPVMSVINYFALCAMTGVPMAFVLGGSVLRLSTSQKAGRVGGLLVGLIIFVVSAILYVNIDIVKDADIPMLMVVNKMNPVFTYLYTFTIFALIFNTCFSLFYAVAKRFGKSNEKKTRLILIALVAVGYVLSFSGFKQLVSVMYPIMGYVGILLLAVLAVGFFRKKESLKKEQGIRKRMIHLFSKKIDDTQEFTSKDAHEFDILGKKSSMDTQKIKVAVKEHVTEEFETE